MLPVVAVIKAKPGKHQELESVLRDLVPTTCQEAGCDSYVLHRDAADPSVFVFVENWSSVKHLQAHLSSSHIQQAMARKDELIESLEIRSLQVLV